MPSDSSQIANEAVASRRLTSYLRAWLLDGGCAQHFIVRNLYLRLLGGIYLCAFVSLWTQIDGLIGSRGILPVARFLASLRALNGAEPWHGFPTLCWWNCSDASLQAQCAAGVVLSLLLIAGITPVVTTTLLWALYLSLSVAGQSFLGYQWDALLLEAGFLAIFFSPLQVSLRQARGIEPSAIILWLQRWLIFRLMFLSGVSKIANHDSTWRDGSALGYHYLTQPLPTWTSWFFYHQPGWLAHASTDFTLVVELALPVLMLGPRRLRRIAFVSAVTLQILIAVTGNYGFFNLLAIVLCIPLLDDRSVDWIRRVSRWTRQRTQPVQVELPAADSSALAHLHWPRWVAALLAIIILPITLSQMLYVMGANYQEPAALAEVEQWIAPYRSLNAYGLFATMTRSRQEIILETSDDARHWTSVDFRWKPGNVSERPRFCTPHMPRLDWQMWFAALDWEDNADVVEGLMRGILRGDKPVVDLLAPNSFSIHPPRYVRAVFYDYSFTSAAERARSGAWWKRVDTGRVTPAYSLDTASDPGSPLSPSR